MSHLKKTLFKSRASELRQQNCLKLFSAQNGTAEYLYDCSLKKKKTHTATILLMISYIMMFD